ncbi:MAG: lysophospholipid acyltransferase family protein [Coprobacillaceae bacterium]
MIRIALIVIRVLWILPYWLWIKVRRYKQVDKYSLEERYGFIHSIVGKVNRKGRVEVECHGLENLPEKSGYFMAPNHQGLEDPLAIFQTHERPVRAIVKTELTKAPIIGNVITMLEYWPMNRDDIRGSVRIIKEASNALKNGQNVFVFPEGTRSRNKNNILEFKGGTFKIAVNAKAPIVPIAILDSYKVFDVNSIKKTKVTICYLPAITYEEYQGMHTNDIAKLVHDRVEACIKEIEESRSNT